jgi:putative ABC transport system substrate-binding protein
MPDKFLSHLAEEAWDLHRKFIGRPWLVTPSAPILFFGDLTAYQASPLRIATVGLNPSRLEFPVCSPFSRFPDAQSGIPAYLSSLESYFRTAPYRTWFNSYEQALLGLDASYYGQKPNTALHTDIGSVLRREFITLLGGAATAWPMPVRAQQPVRYRIGHLAIAAPTDNPPPPPANWDAFVQGLREAGYTEQRNVAFEHRSAHDRPELFPRLAAELASSQVDAIFARGTWALAAAKNATTTIPIVGIDLESDPVEAGLVASIARPGGNITGLFLDLSELSGKHLQILKEVWPTTSRVAVIGDSEINAAQLRELGRVAKSLALETLPVELKSTTDLEDAFASAKAWDANALIVLSNPLNLAYRARIADVAAKYGLPTIYLYRAHVDAGGLISYGPDLPDMFRRAGGYIARILGGTKPADLPIQRPTRFEMVVNLRTARLLGITVPETVLVRADEVIE